MSEDWLAKYESKHNDPAKRESTTKVISTSYQEIDEALGIGGLPLGNVIDIAGPAGCGKSSLALDIVASAQERNLSVVYLDIDCSFDAGWAATRKVKLDDLLIFQPKPGSIDGLITACLSIMEQGLGDIIVFDSISALALTDGSSICSLKNVLNPLVKELDKYKTSLIFLSQIRHDYLHGGETVPKNGVINDVANIRMMLKYVESIKHLDVLIGKKIEVDIYKNDLADVKKTTIELFI